MIDIILFDLDDTLYRPDSGVMEQVRRRIQSYIESRLGLSPAEAGALRRKYFEQYGTTMRGLQVCHQIDADEFLDYVHTIPLEKYLRHNSTLDAVLEAIVQRKAIFTNASREHAERVLAVLGVRRHFSQIIDVRDVDYESKPQPAAYHRCCKLLAVRPEACMLVEDNPRNLRPAKLMGMVTVLVADGDRPAEADTDHVIARVEDIGSVVANR